MTKILQNFFKTTVSVAWGTGTGNLYITTKPTSNTAGWLVVSPNSASLREIVTYSGTGTDGTGDYIVCTARGVGGTTAQVHAVAEPVRMNITAEHWADIFVSPTFTGNVTVPTPTATTDAATKAYVDGVAIAGGADASTTVKGISKLSTAPASATEPIAVGDNDGRVPTQTENDTLGAIVAGTDFYAASAVGTDSYAITISPAITAYATGMKFRFKADVANTGACTLAVSGLSALAIKKLNDQDLATGDIEAGQIVEVVYDGTDFQMQSQMAQVIATNVKFGGTGADGALALTSGATNIDLGAVAYVEKNYTSISITGTGSLTFSNPHANGTVIVLRSQGNVTLTSSTAPMIDASGMGAAAATQASSFSEVAGTLGTVGQAGQNNAASTGGAGGSVYSSGFGLELYTTTANKLYRRFIHIFPGSGGVAGGAGFLRSGVAGVAGTGGRGGGALLIEAAGSWNFTTASGISVSGTNGTNGTAATGTCAGGGGGGSGGKGGVFLALYNTLTANTGTVNISSGSGGNGGDGITAAGADNNGSGGAGGGVAGGVVGAGGSGANGNNAANGSNGSSGSGASGGGTVNAPGGQAAKTGGTGGTPDTSSGLSIITANNWFN